MRIDPRASTALKLLKYSRTLTAGAVLGVIVIVFLVGAQLALLFGVIDIIQSQVLRTRADAWILTKNTVNFDFSSGLPNSYIDRAVGLDGVEYARPIVSTGALMRDSAGRNVYQYIVGVKLPQLVGGPWSFEKGSPASLLDPFSFTIDNTTLMNPNPPIFDQLLDVQQNKFRFNAITNYIRSFRGNVSYTSTDNVRKLSGQNPEFLNAIMVKFREGTNLTAEIDNLARLFPYATVMSSEKLANETVKYYLLATGLGQSLLIGAALSGAIGLIVIGLTLYNNILSHEKEIAILRVLGARRKDILIILVYQVLCIAVIGLVIGFVILATGLHYYAQTRIPVALPLWFGPVHVFLTILLCLLGSLYAMRHALKIEPSSAFR